MLTVDESGDSLLLLGSERRHPPKIQPEPIEYSPLATQSQGHRRSWLSRPIVVAGAAVLAAVGVVCLAAAARSDGPRAAAVGQSGSTVEFVQHDKQNVFRGGGQMHPVQDGNHAAFIPMPGSPPETTTPEVPARSEHGRARPPIGAMPSAKPVDYQVIFEGHVHIREEKDAVADVIGNLWKCTVFKAVPDGSWVKLLGRDGYVMTHVGGIPLIKPIPIYYRLKVGTCDALAAYPISDKHTCELAAAAMKLADTDAKHVDSIPSPEGCYYKDDDTLWMAEKSSFTKPEAMPGRELICSSYPDPSTDCHPITTTMTTTTPLADSWPSLFCFSVVRSEGYEPPLVRRQLKEKASIFACNEFTVLSNGGKVWLSDDWFATEIPIPEVGMGDLSKQGVTTNSWLNTEIFMMAWDLIRQDGRFEKHDWTVKADPDAVLFAWRIQNLVKPHTAKPPARTPKVPPLTDMLYFLNCDRSPPTPPGQPQLFGAVELFSRAALLAYYYSSVKNGQDCKKELNWHGWGEDSYMQHCMETLGAQPVREFGWVADDRCIPGACWDKGPAAFHDFKDVNAWFTCWNQGLKAQPRPGGDVDTLPDSQE